MTRPTRDKLDAARVTTRELIDHVAATYPRDEQRTHDVIAALRTMLAATAPEPGPTTR